MYQQLQERCPTCKGMGEIFDEEKKCKTCTGEKVLEKEVNLSVALQKGTPHGFSSILVNEGDELVISVELCSLRQKQVMFMSSSMFKNTIFSLLIRPIYT